MTTKEEFFSNPSFLEDYKRISGFINEYFGWDPVEEGVQLPDGATWEQIEEQAVRRQVDLGTIVGYGLSKNYKEKQPHITFETLKLRIITVDLEKELDKLCQELGVSEKSKWFFGGDVFHWQGIKALIKLYLPDHFAGQLTFNPDAISQWVQASGNQFLMEAVEESTEESDNES